MKKLMMMMMGLAAVLTAGSMMAQDSTAGRAKRTPEEIAAKRSASLKEKLALSDAQTTQVKALLTDNMSKMAAVKAKYKDNKKGMGAEMKPLQEEFKTKMKGILTAEQYTKWEQMQAEMRAKHKEGHHGHHKKMGMGKDSASRTPEAIAAKQSAFLKEKLTLTEAQTVAVKTLITENVTKMREVKAKNGTDKKAMAEGMKPLKEEFKTRMKSILTADQYTKWEQMKTDAKAKHKTKKDKAPATTPGE